MKIETQKLPKNILEAKVTLSEEEMKPFYLKALEKIAASFTLPGFRRGAAPLPLVRLEVGEYKITDEAVSLAIEEKYGEIIKKLNVEIAAPPQVALEKVAPENELIFKLNFALIPKVKLANFKKIKTKKEISEIKEEEIKKFLENLQESRAKQIRKESPGVIGDLVKADIEMFFEGATLENGTQKDAVFILGKNYYLKEFSQNLVDAKINEMREFALDYPSDYLDKKLAGKRIDFKVKIKEIFSRELPPLDDSFAQSLGGFKNIEELKNQIKNNLLEEKKGKTEQKFELEILKEIAGQSEFEEIPNILIEKELTKMMIEMEESVKNILKLEFSDYLNMMKKTNDELKKEFVPQAEERIKAALIIREVALKEKINVEEKELEEEKERLKRIYADKKEILDSLDKEDFKNYLENTIINRKTIEYLKKICA